MKLTMKVVAASGLLALSAMQASLAQQAVAAKPAAVQAPAAKAVGEEESAMPNKPGEQGIKVHGHWVLQVKNADGTLGERREFDNSLVAGTGLNTTSGDQLLGGLLSGAISPGGLAVAFIKGPVTTTGLDTSSFCNAGVSGQAAVPAGIGCYPFFPANSVWLNGGLFNFNFNGSQSGLSQTVTFSPTVAVVLTGNYIVPGALTEIDAVQTYAGYCYFGNTSLGQYRFTGSALPFSKATSSPASCAGTPPTGSEYISFGALTSTNVPTPLTGLTSGQVITVTVTLSFS